MSQLLKANKAEQAFKELDAMGMSEEHQVKIKKEIKECDKKHYHVIVVKKINNVKKERYEVSAYVQIYNPRGYANLKKNASSMPINKLIVLHDPTLEVSDEAVDALPNYETKAIEAKVKKDLEAKHKKELEEAIEKAKKEALEEANAKTDASGTDEGDNGADDGKDGAGDVSEATQKRIDDFKALPFNDQKALAKQYGVKPEGNKKTDLEEAVEAYLIANADKFEQQ